MGRPWGAGIPSDMGMINPRPGCKAPVRGHKTLRGMLDCPACKSAATRTLPLGDPSVTPDVKQGSISATSGLPVNLTSTARAGKHNAGLTLDEEAWYTLITEAERTGKPVFLDGCELVETKGEDSMWLDAHDVDVTFHGCLIKGSPSGAAIWGSNVLLTQCVVTCTADLTSGVLVDRCHFRASMLGNGDHVVADGAELTDCHFSDMPIRAAHGASIIRPMWTTSDRYPDIRTTARIEVDETSTVEIDTGGWTIAAGEAPPGNVTAPWNRTFIFKNFLDAREVTIAQAKAAAGLPSDQDAFIAPDNEAAWGLYLETRDSKSDSLIDEDALLTAVALAPNRPRNSAVGFEI